MENEYDITAPSPEEPEEIKRVNTVPEEIDLIGVKITYKTDRDCYARFEEFLLRGQKASFSALGVLFCFTALSAYTLYKTQEYAVIGMLAFLIALYLALEFLKGRRGTQKFVNRYYDKDGYYGCNKQICFETNAISFCAYDENAEKFFEAVYPYTMLEGIFVTPKDYYFIIGNQALIFPRDFATKFCDDAQLLELFKSTGRLIRI